MCPLLHILCTVSFILWVCVGCVWGLCEAWYAMAQKTAAAVMFLCTVCRRVETVGVLTNEVTDFYILLGLGSWGGAGSWPELFRRGRHILLIFIYLNS